MDNKKEIDWNKFNQYIASKKERMEAEMVEIARWELSKLEHDIKVEIEKLNKLKAQVENIKKGLAKIAIKNGKITFNNQNSREKGE